MSLERELRRRAMLNDMKSNGMRTRCRKCGNVMATKPGHGWVCAKCGWESAKQKSIRAELEQ